MLERILRLWAVQTTFCLGTALFFYLRGVVLAHGWPLIGGTSAAFCAAPNQGLAPFSLGLLLYTWLLVMQQWRLAMRGYVQGKVPTNNEKNNSML